MSDALAPFGQVVLAIRWGTTAISLALASPDIQDGDLTVLLSMSGLVGYSVYRTRRPLRFDQPVAGMVKVVSEVGGTVLALVATGYWESPLVFSMLTAVAVAGFARSFGFAVRLAAAAVIAVSLPWMLEQHHPDGALRTSAEWGGEVVLVALVAGYARRISGEADEGRVLALDRLGRLTDANVLLFQLHQVSQTLPASLDLDEVLDTTMSQVRDLFDADTVALVLRDDVDGRWHTARRSGGPAATTYGPDGLPPPLLRAERLRSPTREDDMHASGGPGVAPGSRSGIYAILEARGDTIGLLALEHADPEHFTDRDTELVRGFVDPAAMAIDNARWFGRLRTVGAAEERTRIARDIHDRIGQSLAYVAFELDRLTKKSDGGTEVATSLDRLRGDVRTVIAELRDTLYDLRTEVTDEDGLAAVLPGFLDRVEARTALTVHLDVHETGRLPIRQERELWRIAQEAVTNVERHAHAANLRVTWTSDGRTGELVVEDDGVGLASTTGGSLGAQSLSALRERAASIGATLGVDSGHDTGTRVRCTLAGR